MEENKWTISISAELKENISPEITIKDKIDENQDLEITVKKDKVYANYELRF